MKKRCTWVSDDILDIQYHDTEWGRPVDDDLLLFEMLCLEGQQAGLSWSTILKKREGYRQCFYQFDPLKIVQMTNKEMLDLLNDKRIIRNQFKIFAIFENAKAFLKIQKYTTFSNFIWKYVDDQPIVNHWEKISDIPKQTKTSQLLAQELKKMGFIFIGPIICYSFMQAVGMVNDHLISCFCHPDQEKYY